MRQSSYLVRKGARYHFRRRLPSVYKCSQPISIALGTAYPAEARRLSRRLAARWDELLMLMEPTFERCHLTIAEQQALFRAGLEEELALASAHLTAPMAASRSDDHNHKIMAAAYRIVARVPHYAAAIPSAIIESEVGRDWSYKEKALLTQVLRLFVTPMSVSRTAAADKLEELGTPVNDGTCREGRSHLLRGYAEAHLRVSEAQAMGMDLARIGPHRLLEENWSGPAQAASTPSAPFVATEVGAGNFFFAKRTSVRFSEQLGELHDMLFEDNGWQPTTVRPATCSRSLPGSLATSACRTTSRLMSTNMCADLGASPRASIGAAFTLAERWQSRSTLLLSLFYQFPNAARTGRSTAI